MALGFRRRTALVAAVGAPLGSAAVAGVQPRFPRAAVRLVLPFPPGTVNDTITRLVADRLAARWRQPVSVDNRPGASSMLGTAHVAQAAPDGHTLLVNITLMLQNPALRRKLPYDPQALVPVAQFNRQQLPLFARGDLGLRSVSHLFALAQAQPDKLNFASWGLGSTAHLLLEKLQKDKGVRLTHLPYKGGAEIIKALLSGEADVAVADFLSPAAHFRSGRLRVLAVTGPARVAHLPDVPTLAESGVPGFEGYNWTGLFAPAGTPVAVLQQIAADIAAVQAEPGLAARLRDELYVEPTALGPAAFAEVYRRDAERWRRVIRETGVRLDA